MGRHVGPGPGEEHRITLSPEQLAAIVTQATEAATQNVAAKNRRRLVYWSFIAGMLASSAIGIPTTVVLTENAISTGKAAARYNALVNCRLVRQLAHTDEVIFRQRIIDSKRFQSLSKDRFGLTPQQYKALVKHNEAEELERLGGLRQLASTNCKAAIG